MVQIFLPFKNEFCFHSGIWNIKSLSVTSLAHVQALNLWWGVSKVSCCWTTWSCTNKGSCSLLKYWKGKGVVPYQACTGRVLYPKMETVRLLLFKIFFQEQRHIRLFVFKRWYWTISSPLFLQRRAWWLFLNLPACAICTWIHHYVFFFLLHCQPAWWSLFSAVDRAGEKARKVLEYVSRPVPAKCASVTKQSMQIPWPLVFYHHLS